MKAIFKKADQVRAKIARPLAKGVSAAKKVTLKLPVRKFSQAGRSNRFKKLLAGIIIILGLTQLVFGVLIYGFHLDNQAVRLAARIFPYPAAISNFSIITYHDYLTEKDYIHQFYKATKQEGTGFEEIDNQILDQLIENKLVNFEALRNNIKITSRDVEDSIAIIVEQNGGQEKVEKVLEEYYGLNLKGFRKLVKNQLIRDKVDDELIAKVTARHILVRVDKEAPAAEVEETKKKIDGYLAEIKGGLDFAEAAKKYSEDVGSNEQGGELEPFAMGDMVAEFSDAAFATAVGQISEPVRSEFGWHIIKVESRSGTIDKKFTDWLADIKAKSIVWRLM